MKLSIDLSPAQADRLRVEAERLGLTPEDLARAAITDLLAATGEDVHRETHAFAFREVVNPSTAMRTSAVST